MNNEIQTEISGIRLEWLTEFPEWNYEGSIDSQKERPEGKLINFTKLTATEFGNCNKSIN